MNKQQAAFLRREYRKTLIAAPGDRGQKIMAMTPTNGLAKIIEVDPGVDFPPAHKGVFRLRPFRAAVGDMVLVSPTGKPVALGYLVPGQGYRILPLN